MVNPPDGEPCDFWIVMGFAHERENAWVAPENTLFICGEPPAKKLFPRSFYRQFHRVVDTHAYSQHPRLELFASCLGWAVRGDYDSLNAMRRPHKQNRIGVVCSSTAKTSGQRRRLRFLDELKKRLPDQIVHFGRGFRPVDDKMEAILPYRFQLVLENSISPHYWTEKLADAFLGWAHPLYVGCPNLADYFEPASWTALDIENPEGSAALCLSLLNQTETEAERQAIMHSRSRMLDKYNIISRAAELANRWHVAEAQAKNVEIRTYKAFKWINRLIGRRSFPRTARRPR